MRTTLRIVWPVQVGSIFVTLCIALASLPARADQTDPLLEPLLEALAQNDDAQEAQTLEERILRIWRDPGSPSIDLLMTRAQMAIDRRDYDLALRHLDDVVDLAPAYAEGWFSRATVYFLTDHYDQAISDFERVVRLETRHFNAWASLGRIFMEIGNDARALSAFRRALEANPFQHGVAENVKRLERDVEGQGI